MNDATTVSQLIDEKSLRRPDFKGGEPIVLADGGEWFFPKPCVVFRPRFASGVVSSRHGTDLGIEFDQAVAQIADLTRVRGEDEPAAGVSFVDALFQLAVLMLRINYDLTDDQLVTLLEYKLDDEASQDTWTDILDTARGYGKKATRGMIVSQS